MRTLAHLISLDFVNLLFNLALPWCVAGRSFALFCIGHGKGQSRADGRSSRERRAGSAKGCCVRIHGSGPQIMAIGWPVAQSLVPCGLFRCDMARLRLRRRLAGYFFVSVLEAELSQRARDVEAICWLRRAAYPCCKW